MDANDSNKDESFRDAIATVDKDGKRVWVYAKKIKGKWFNKRQYFGYALLAFLFVAPFIKIKGEPLIMLNILERKFVLFGKVFWPEDSHLFAIGMMAFVILIIVFTVVFGRLFCGWACPQTIFLELIFRRIEFWIDGDWNQQKKLEKQPWNAEKIRKRLIKWTIYWIVSFLIANIFLAYIIGIDELFNIITDSPKNHLGGLISLFIFTSVFFAVFTWFREQVCIAVCPYGRLQGVLLDENSILVAYDYKRGEREKGRSKFRKNEDREALGKGDCIDCHQCVNVCPTGIDIRNGTQLECVNCTACMDACDSIMEGVGLEKGLIRYDSEAGIKTGDKYSLSGRAKAYIVLMVGILTLLVVLLATRADIEVNFLRERGTSYQKTGEDEYANIYNLHLINKTQDTIPIYLEVEGNNASIDIIGGPITLAPGAQIKRKTLIKMNVTELKGTKTPVLIGIYENDKKIETASITFSGPGF
ncbi:cytochrome c oxidase accessory protein CcoG [Putridiphycobacter roseus]|uniref:Cytochrome c oxidase accessory protein CcoG n=1 Tax=Putridiphycobacter roseus TaxID=2219161 RepID=A0A2W1MYV8_9FLAO|nr:cytochrome c oxidase accessory protein CcoG [Putridiphycobacter roseus]PZE16420.1 cytochrome c oxidase accessory protein CcoG [Putridiphycobacter roseus]